MRNVAIRIVESWHAATQYVPVAVSVRSAGNHAVSQLDVERCDSLLVVVVLPVLIICQAQRAHQALVHELCDQAYPSSLQAHMRSSVPKQGIIARTQCFQMNIRRRREGMCSWLPHPCRLP